MPESQAQDEDQILILTANHTSRVVSIHKSGVTVGSKPDNDIVLDDPQVAQYHARIERDGGHYQVIDLNSASGTFLGDLRLRAGVPVEWTPDKTLRIGENRFGLRMSGGEAEPAETAPSQALPEIDPNLIHWSANKQIGVYVATEQLSIAPGKSSTVSMVLYNQGQSTVHLHLTVSGVPLSWVGSIPSVEAIPAQAEQQANLGIHLPQAPTPRAGRHVVTIQVTNQETPLEQVEFTITLTILACAFSCTLYPETHTPTTPPN
jgi:predicted component of type VI protein secretion system